MDVIDEGVDLGFLIAGGVRDWEIDEIEDLACEITSDCDAWHWKRVI